MSVIRVHKNKNFTVMSNVHLRDMDLSLKAKGLLSVMLSLPDNWNYSIAGLCSICKENETAIKSTIKELKERGYVIVDKKYPNQTESKKYEYVYHIFEEPQPENQEVEKQGVENLPLDNLPIENHPLNKRTDIPSTDKSNTDTVNTDGLNTDNNSFSDEKDNSKETLELHNSHFPEEQKNESRISMSLGTKKKQSREKPLKDMPTRAKEIADCLVDDKELSEGVQQCIEYFLEKYKRKNHKGHLPLRNETLQSVVEVMLSSLTVPHDEDLENRYQCVFYPLVSEASEWEDRKEVIDKYFNTEFREKCDYSLVHFTQRDIITHVMQKCSIGEDTYWFYSESVD
ncbi:MAG: helix-turn-helix domain-containing protein [Lachnospiraceae bacterium]|nr:helix-turn-helix domain-containing protein [Lachnospiraceae bacterium]